MPDATPSMTELLARLDRWLAEHRPEYYQRLQPGVSPAELDDLEQLIGFKLCPEYRQLYLWRNGEREPTDPVVFHPKFDGGGLFVANHAFIALNRVRSVWECYTTLKQSGDFKGPHCWSENWAPFSNDGGRTWVVDHAGTWTGHRGQIIFFHGHYGPERIEAPSLESWLQLYVDSLEAGEWASVLSPPSGTLEFQCVKGHDPRLPGYPIGVGAEVRDFLAQPLQLGEHLEVWDGAFKGMNAEVKRIAPGGEQVELAVEIFGRQLSFITERTTGGYSEPSCTTPKPKSKFDEAKWRAAATVGELLADLPDFFTERKAAFCICSCCRQVLDLFPEVVGLRLIEMCEDYSDRQGSRPELEALWNPIEHQGRLNVESPARVLRDVLWPLRSPMIRDLAKTVASALGNLTLLRPSEEPKFLAILRHILGDPLRLTPEGAAYPAAVAQLAESLYQQDQAGIDPLHDALLDAGLTELAEHFADKSQWHPKGCWALDWLTGRK